MKRILHIVTSVDAGGVGSMLNNFLSEYDNYEFSFSILAIEKPNKQFFEDSFIAKGISITYMPKNLIKRFVFILIFLKKNRFDIVHCHIELASAIYLLICSLFGVRHRISHAHMAFIPYRKFYQKILRFILIKVSDVKCACSESAGYNLYGEKIKFTVLYNAFDVKPFQFSLEVRNITRSLYFLGDDFTVGFIGRLTYQKNIFFLLEIFEHVIRINSEAKLLIVGDGELREAFIEKINEKGLQNSVLLLGLRKDIKELLMAFDVILLPSRWEGLGIVLIEAQAASLRCITSNNVPIDETCVTDLISYMELDLGAEKWAAKLIEDKNSRENNRRENVGFQNVLNSKYNINLERKVLFNIYSNLNS